MLHAVPPRARGGAGSCPGPGGAAVSADPAAFLAALRATPPRRMPVSGAMPAAAPPGPDLVNAVIRWHDPGPAPDFVVGLKDIFAAPGHSPGGGTALPLDPLGGPATVVARLQAAGGGIAAWLNLDELSAGGSGENLRHGRCRNPWAEDRLTGGSSSGSAAAVASGAVPMSLGSDAGGSIRIPSAWCGVTGHKPTYGHVSRAGALARAWSVDCIGPLGRRADHCAALLSVIAGEDPADPTTWRPPDPGDTVAPEDLRIGLVVGLADPETERALAAAADALRALGCRVVPRRLPDLRQMNRDHQTIVKAEAAALHHASAEAEPGRVDPAIAAALRAGAQITATELLRARDRRVAATAVAGETLFAGCDLLLMPVTPGPAPRAEAGAARRFDDDAALTRFANFLGLPATAFPVGLPRDGLPRAAQLVGRPFEDSLCLGVVAAFQAVTAHHLALPPPPPDRAPR